jgi:transmembrane sensor
MGDNDNAAPPGSAEMDEAADWIDRLDELDAGGRRELATWLNASSANAAAFELMRRTITDTALLQAAERARAAASAAPAEAPASRSTTPPRRRPAAFGFGLLAASLAGLIVLVAIGFEVASRPGAERPLVLATAIGARSDYGLSDRSVVHLNADSQISVRYSPAARDLTLQKGDALFDVAKNPDRPFNVMAGAATVTAVGTSFEVDRLGDAVEVRVFEGVVRIAPHVAAPQLVRKGEWLRLAGDGQTVGGRFESDGYQSWRSDWLVADQTPLKYVIARLNRYSADPIDLGGGPISDLRITGRFRLSQPAGALAMISALADARVAREGAHLYMVPRGIRAAD